MSLQLPELPPLAEPITDWQIGRIVPTPTHIPTGWSLVRLTSVARLESGHTPSRRRPEYWKGDIPWISLHDSNALDVAEIIETSQTIGPLGLANSSARILPKGTVVFSRTATVGKSTVMGREMATSQDFANYVCGDQVYNHYLAQLFRFMQPEWSRLMAGSTHNTIYMPVFRDLQILLPPRSEQEAIANALADVDALVVSLDQLLAKKRDIKQVVMQDLLSGRRRLGTKKEKTSENPGWAKIPKDWDLLTLGDIFSFKNGLNKEKKYFGRGTPIVNYMDVYKNSYLTQGSLSGRVQVNRQEIENYSVRRGDVLFTRTSETPIEVGFAAVMLNDVEDTVFSGFLLRARPIFDRLENEFKKFCFQSMAVRRAVVSTSSYTTRALTNGRLLSAVPILCPPRDEQLAIAEVLSDMEAELVVLQARRDKVRAIKQGMMQELLTGRTRLI